MKTKKVNIKASTVAVMAIAPALLVALDWAAHEIKTGASTKSDREKCLNEIEKLIAKARGAQTIMEEGN